jgi:hypothetical protein
MVQLDLTFRVVHLGWDLSRERSDATFQKGSERFIGPTSKAPWQPISCHQCPLWYVEANIGHQCINGPVFGQAAPLTQLSSKRRLSLMPICLNSDCLGNFSALAGYV